MHNIISQQSRFSLNYCGMYIANISQCNIPQKFYVNRKLSSSAQILISIAYSFYLNYLRQSEISIGNLLCCLIRTLLSPYLGQLIVYKLRAMPSNYLTKYLPINWGVPRGTAFLVQFSFPFWSTTWRLSIQIMC